MNGIFFFFFLTTLWLWLVESQKVLIYFKNIKNVDNIKYTNLSLLIIKDTCWKKNCLVHIFKEYFPNA
ncbi:hypothetical protein PFFCH_03280 [Plasmodium falciparum FCH/4]|uniref:Uncharacterized protein n=1 Tax=Plasmodium falciparum FCH/4 TaxID=1036724 RepID=A0A024VKN3_PLAFA|nr:hypothetical protein PFFCH_03280 [Plasmodium falciparum FCH/4]